MDVSFSGGLFDAFDGNEWQRLDGNASAIVRRRDFRSYEFVVCSSNGAEFPLEIGCGDPVEVDERQRSALWPQARFVFANTDDLRAFQETFKLASDFFQMQLLRETLLTSHGFDAAALPPLVACEPRPTVGKPTISPDHALRSSSASPAHRGQGAGRWNKQSDALPPAGAAAAAAGGDTPAASPVGQQLSESERRALAKVALPPFSLAVRALLDAQGDAPDECPEGEDPPPGASPRAPPDAAPDLASLALRTMVPLCEVAGDPWAATDPHVASLFCGWGVCHCCGYRRALVARCPHTVSRGAHAAAGTRHTYCAGCLQRGLGADYHALRTGLLQWRCPVCTGACPCTACSTINGGVRPFRFHYAACVDTGMLSVEAGGAARRGLSEPLLFPGTASQYPGGSVYDPQPGELTGPDMVVSRRYAQRLQEAGIPPPAHLSKAAGTPLAALAATAPPPDAASGHEKGAGSKLGRRPRRLSAQGFGTTGRRKPAAASAGRKPKPGGPDLTPSSAGAASELGADDDGISPSASDLDSLLGLDAFASAGSTSSRGGGRKRLAAAKATRAIVHAAQGIQVAPARPPAAEASRSQPAATPAASAAALAVKLWQERLGRPLNDADRDAVLAQCTGAITPLTKGLSPPPGVAELYATPAVLEPGGGCAIPGLNVTLADGLIGVSGTGPSAVNAQRIASALLETFGGPDLISALTPGAALAAAASTGGKRSPSAATASAAPPQSSGGAKSKHGLGPVLDAAKAASDRVLSKGALLCPAGTPGADAERLLTALQAVLPDSPRPWALNVVHGRGSTSMASLFCPAAAQSAKTPTAAAVQSGASLAPLRCVLCDQGESRARSRRRSVAVHPLMPIRASGRPVIICDQCEQRVLDTRAWAASQGLIHGEDGMEELCSLCGAGTPQLPTKLTLCSARVCVRGLCEACMDMVVDTAKGPRNVRVQEEWLCPPCAATSALEMHGLELLQYYARTPREGVAPLSKLGAVSRAELSLAQLRRSLKRPRSSDLAVSGPPKTKRAQPAAGSQPGQSVALDPGLQAAVEGLVRQQEAAIQMASWQLQQARAQAAASGLPDSECNALLENVEAPPLDEVFPLVRATPAVLAVVNAVGAISNEVGQQLTLATLHRSRVAIFLQRQVATVLGAIDGPAAAGGASAAESAPDGDGSAS
ncbi:hypothetical protein FNF28_00645 [Cafeteria roenbergensis]|uniref:Zinc-finger domain-containing protein n=2 Tax=Cafeteria roenbergensis TaxID=33653 RepID=A0A5A8E1U0_CAFRO|nr:hypothetical protein FNF28_00645 [Cafeteria roenbergensis]